MTGKQHTAEKPKWGPLCFAASGIASLAAAVLFNPVGYRLLVPGGDVLEMGAVRAAAWLGALALAGIGVGLILGRRRLSPVNGLLFLLSCALCASGIEGTLALLGAKPLYHAILRVPPLAPWWEVDAEKGGRYVAEKFTGSWPINAQGFGDTDAFEIIGEGKNLARVLLLGDSYAFGAHASAFEKSFASLIEGTPRNLVAWNTAIPGTGQKRQLKSLRTFYPLLEPHMVILAFSMNDFEDNLFPLGQHYVFANGAWVHRYQRQPDGQVRILEPEAAYRRAFGAQTPQQYLKSSRMVTLAISAMVKFEKRFQPARETVVNEALHDLPGFRETKDLMTAIRDYIHENMGRLVVVLVPQREDLLRMGRAYAAARALCEDLGITLLELRGSLTARDYVSTLDGHWNDSGHAKAARAITSIIAPHEAPAPSSPNASSTFQ